MTLIAPARVAPFPHEAYVAPCSCPSDVGILPSTNYHGQTIAAPRCQGCGRRFVLEIALMLPSRELAATRPSPPASTTARRRS